MLHPKLRLNRNRKRLQVVLSRGTTTITSDGIFTRELLRKVSVKFPWWCFPQKDYELDAVVIWLHLRWWYLCKWKLLGPIFRAAKRLGVWHVDELAPYVSGHLQWPDMWTRRVR